MAVGTSGVGRLPHLSDDPVIRLYAHYYEPADLMHQKLAKLEIERAKKGRLSQTKERHRSHYLRLWLALLYVVCKEFESNVETYFFSRPDAFKEL